MAGPPSDWAHPVSANLQLNWTTRHNHLAMSNFVCDGKRTACRLLRSYIASVSL